MRKIKDSKDRKIVYSETFAVCNGAVLEDLQNKFFVFSQTINDEEPSPYQLAFREGQRSVVLYIMNQLKRASEGSKNDGNNS